MSLSVLVIVLHYRGLDDTLECLASLAHQSYAHAHVLVVDNGSGDHLKARFLPNRPELEVLELAENEGWSGGNNRGIELARSRKYDFVCLLNNDTVVPPECFERLMARAARLGACILHPAIDSYGDDKQEQLDPTIPYPPGMQIRQVPEQPGVFEVNTVNGACVLVHRSVFENIGLIDNRFFLLCEDADFAERATRAGIKIFCDSSIRIQHKESRAFGGRRAPIKIYYGLRNLLLFHEKHRLFSRAPLRSARTLLWTVYGNSVAAGARPHSLLRLLRWCVSPSLEASATRMALRDYLLRRFGRLNVRDEAELLGTAPSRGPDSLGTGGTHDPSHTSVTIGAE